MSTPVQPLVTCPFCDSSDVSQVIDRAVCRHCGATGPPALTTTDSTVVWSKWNNRRGRHQWRELESLIIDAVQSWGDHFGVETRDIVGADKAPPIWQQVRMVLSRVLDR